MINKSKRHKQMKHSLQNHMIVVLNKRYLVVLILVFVIVFIANTQYSYDYNFKFKINVSRNNVKSINSIRNFVNKERVTMKNISKNKIINTPQELKYILLWTTDTSTPFVYLGKGQSIFKEKMCQWTNCYVTSDRNYLGHYTEFDVVAFNGPQIQYNDMPRDRSLHQKYVYANIEAADNYPTNAKLLNGFFNWTWTYKLNSDALWGYVAVRNATKHVVGPKINMHWISLDDMDPIDDKLKEKLRSKTKAAAWFSSNCFTLSKREKLVKQIQDELKIYGLEVDVFGSCGKSQCPSKIMTKCMNFLQKNYYFYFAFENALNEDYVTEKIVYALKYNTVPVVYGGANYSRFMPEGIYLNALELGPKALAKKMYQFMRSPSEYYKFFRWQKYYSFHFRNEHPDTDDYCQFCALLNDESLTKVTSIYEHIDTWWATSLSTSKISRSEEIHQLISTNYRVTSGSDPFIFY